MQAGLEGLRLLKAPGTQVQVKSKDQTLGARPSPEVRDEKGLGRACAA